MNTRRAVMQVGAICLKVSLFVLIVLGVIYLGQTTYRYTRAVFSDQAYEEEPGRNVKVKISDTVTVKEAAEILEKKGLVEDADIFRIQWKAADLADTVKAGEYELNSSMTPSEIAKILSGTD